MILPECSNQNISKCAEIFPFFSLGLIAYTPGRVPPLASLATPLFVQLLEKRIQFRQSENIIVL